MIHAHFVDLIQQEKRVFHLNLGHFLHQFTRHGTDISTAVPTDFRFIAHPAQRHTHELTVCRPGNGLTQ